MDRYNTNKKIKNKNIASHSSIIYPKIERSSNDIYIRARLGDRLDHLAYEYYNDVSLWWIIAEANGLGKGSMAIPTGNQIRIPMDTDKIINDFNSSVQNRVI